MIESDEDKKLVDQYKQTNIALRKQLHNLNAEIDKILTKRSNKVGLQKLPSVSKKITDPNVMQQQVQNLRKRLELLEHDAAAYREKAGVNYHHKVREQEAQIQSAVEEIEQCKRAIKEYERKDKIADVQAMKLQQSPKKWENRISKLQEEISRLQKIEKDLLKQVNYQVANDHRASNYMQELAVKHHEAKIKKQKQESEGRKKSPAPLQTQPQTSIGEQQWKELKKEFLTFKKTKENEERALNQENERLRLQIKQWQRKIKEKKKRIETIMVNEQRNKNRASKVYSTLEDSSNKQSRVYRYRDRNNSMQYNAKEQNKAGRSKIQI